MRTKLLVAFVLVACCAAFSASTAGAATTWPAKCTSFKCVNAHLNALHNQDLAFKKTLKGINAFLNCFVVAPGTEYPGYFADDGSGGTIEVPALDFTATSDTVDIWLLGINPGTCGQPTTAATPHGGSSTLSVGPYRLPILDLHR